jgi:hypothetical protein
VFVVKYSPAFRWSIFLLLPLTIGWKLIVTPEGALDLRDRGEIQEKLVEFLNRHQFDVDIEKLLDAPVIRASTETCQMLIMNVSLDGWQRDLIRGRARTTDRVLFIFRGKVYADQPAWLTAAVGFWSRQLQRLGLLRNVPPVIAVIAPRLCNAERLPWDELALTANDSSADLGGPA